MAKKKDSKRVEIWHSIMSAETTFVVFNKFPIKKDLMDETYYDRLMKHNKECQFRHVSLLIPMAADKDGGVYYFRASLTKGGFHLNILVNEAIIDRMDPDKYNDIVVVPYTVNPHHVTQRAMQLVQKGCKFSESNHFDLLMTGKDNSRATDNEYMTCSTMVAHLLGIENYDSFTCDTLYQFLGLVENTCPEYNQSHDSTETMTSTNDVSKGKTKPKKKKGKTK